MAFALSAKKQCIVQIKRVASNQKHLLLIQRYNCIFIRVEWVKVRVNGINVFPRFLSRITESVGKKPWEMVYKW